MYNEARKLEWIEDEMRRGSMIEHSRIISAMNRLSDGCESVLDADIFDLVCTGRKLEAIHAINSNLGFYTYSTIRRFVYTVNAYLSWRFAVDTSSLPSQDMLFDMWEFSLIETFRSSTYIKSEQELSIQLANECIEDGQMLPIFAALAWCGYTPQEMVKILQCDVDDTGSNIVIEKKKIPSGYVNDILLYYSRTNNYYVGQGKVLYKKDIGPYFLRNISKSERKTGEINMLRKVQNSGPLARLPSGGTIQYQQLIQAGCFRRYLRYEEAGDILDVRWFRQKEHISLPTAQGRVKEFSDFKIAIGITP